MVKDGKPAGGSPWGCRVRHDLATEQQGIQFGGIKYNHSHGCTTTTVHFLKFFITLNRNAIPTKR